MTIAMSVVVKTTLNPTELMKLLYDGGFFEVPKEVDKGKERLYQLSRKAGKFLVENNKAEFFLK
jgi:hypothetical protein